MRSEVTRFPSQAFASFSKGGFSGQRAETAGCPPEWVVSSVVEEPAEHVAAWQLGSHVAEFLPMECEWK